MFEKIKKYQKHPYVQQLQDVRVVGLLVFVVLVLLVSWSGVKVIQTNYNLEKQITRLQQEVEVLELENSNQKLRNQYYNTDQFLELAARRQFGLAAPGEKLILVPKQVALAHTVDLPKMDEKEVAPVVERPKYQENFEAWVDFFLHRREDESQE